MRAVIQTVSEAKVTVKGDVVGSCGEGYMILLGVHEDDTMETADQMIKKILNLRIFPDAQLKMNLCIGDIKGEILLVSQFTLYGDTAKGNRPSFIKAARPDVATPIYEHIRDELNAAGVKTQTGQFGAMMEVSLVNQGPTTIILEI